MIEGIVISLKILEIGMGNRGSKSVILFTWFLIKNLRSSHCVYYYLLLVGA